MIAILPIYNYLNWLCFVRDALFDYNDMILILLSVGYSCDIHMSLSEYKRMASQEEVKGLNDRVQRPVFYWYDGAAARGVRMRILWNTGSN